MRDVARHLTEIVHQRGDTVQHPVQRRGKTIELTVGTVARHHELGNIALALVKRSVDSDAQLTVGGIAASIN